MTTEDENNRLLYRACADGDLPTASGLVDRISDINWHNPDPGKEEYTFLHQAARGGSCEVCKLLLDKGADLKAKAESGQNVLGVACLYGHFPVAQLLMDRDTTLISKKDYYEETVLHAGCISGNLELVKLLLDKDPGLTQKTNAGFTVLHAGCLSGNSDLVKFLAEKDPQQLKQKDDDDMTILHYACQGGNLDMVLYLITNNLSIYDNDKWDRTCLHHACMYGRWTVIQYLLKEQFSLYSADKDGYTPLKHLMNDVFGNDTDEDKKNKQYCLQQLKAKGEEFLKPEDLAKIADGKSSKIVDKQNTFEFLQGKSADWNDIGRAFGVSLNDRKQVQNDLRLTNDNARLEAVIDKWLESSPTPVTWSRFVDILNNSLNYRAIARQVQTFISQQL